MQKIKVNKKTIEPKRNSTYCSPHYSVNVWFWKHCYWEFMVDIESIEEFKKENNIKTVEFTIKI